MIQIDGLSLPVLESQMRAGTDGRRWTGSSASGDVVVDPWFALLPPVTPVSQAGILHGNNDDMPGFRWFEKPIEDAPRRQHAGRAPPRSSAVGRTGAACWPTTAPASATSSPVMPPRTYLTMATIDGGPAQRWTTLAGCAASS